MPKKAKASIPIVDINAFAVQVSHPEVAGNAIHYLPMIARDDGRLCENERCWAAAMKRSRSTKLPPAGMYWFTGGGVISVQKKGKDKWWFYACANHQQALLPEFFEDRLLCEAKQK